MHKRERVGLKQQNTFSPLGTDINKQGRKRSLYEVTEPLRIRRATQLSHRRKYMWNGLAVLRSYNFREFDIMASLTFFGALNALSTNVLKLRVDNNNHNLPVTNND